MKKEDPFQIIYNYRSLNSQFQSLKKKVSLPKEKKNNKSTKKNEKGKKVCINQPSTPGGSKKNQSYQQSSLQTTQKIQQYLDEMVEYESERLNHGRRKSLLEQELQKEQDVQNSYHCNEERYYRQDSVGFDGNNFLMDEDSQN